jgi:regulator of cell morphogenesis and NO signaling
MSKTVAEFVTEDYRTADVFKKFGIDFCCGGKVTLEEICRKKSINLGDLEKELERLKAAPGRQNNYEKWSLTHLTDHLVNQHHEYVRANLDLIQQYADKVAQVHGPQEPSLPKIAQLFLEAAGELTIHMRKEELVLFPYVKKLEAADKQGAHAPEAHFGTVKNPIAMMEDEHETVGEIFKSIAKLSDNYSPPEWACNTYRVLFAKLKEFEEDLHLHIHLENNILFPKAAELEAQLINGQA